MSLPLIVDIATVIILLLYLMDGYRRGLLLLGLELVGIFLTFYAAFRWAGSAGALIVNYIKLPDGLEKPVGFISLWLALQGLYALLGSWLYPFIPKNIRQSPINKLLGYCPRWPKGW